jgi:DNA-binding response OmpR family regulator
MRILVIEDDEQIAENIHDMLENKTYAVDISPNAQDGLDRLENDPYDLVILDWMLPDKDGPEVCSIIRSRSMSLPILMLTAKTQAEDIITGLDSGADDYLTKPFVVGELVARVRALLRRSNPIVPDPIMNIDDLVIDTNTHNVQRAENYIPLSPKEYALLEFLGKNQGVCLSRLDILSHVWDENADELSNTVDVHIRYLRSKIDEGYKNKLIHTVKGKGYFLDEKNYSHSKTDTGS